MDECSEDFDLFWKHYPKKVGKVKSRIVWNKKAVKGEIPEINRVVDKLLGQKAYKEVLKKRGIFCPEWPDPERYIKYERWDDEVCKNEADQRDVKKTAADRAREAADAITDRLIAARNNSNGGSIVATVDRAE